MEGAADDVRVAGVVEVDELEGPLHLREHALERVAAHRRRLPARPGQVLFGARDRQPQLVADQEHGLGQVQRRALLVHRHGADPVAAVELLVRQPDVLTAEHDGDGATPVGGQRQQLRCRLLRVLPDVAVRPTPGRGAHHVDRVRHRLVQRVVEFDPVEDRLGAVGNAGDPVLVVLHRVHQPQPPQPHVHHGPARPGDVHQVPCLVQDHDDVLRQQLGGVHSRSLVRHGPEREDGRRGRQRARRSRSRWGRTPAGHCNPTCVHYKENAEDVEVGVRKLRVSGARSAGSAGSQLLILIPRGFPSGVVAG